jgi:hypothetical protein
MKPGMTFEQATKEIRENMTHGTLKRKDKNGQTPVDKYWHGKNGQPKAQSYCWLFCWALSGHANVATKKKPSTTKHAVESREVFDTIFTVPFFDIGKKLGKEDQVRKLYELYALSQKLCRASNDLATEIKLDAFLAPL